MVQRVIILRLKPTDPLGRRLELVFGDALHKFIMLLNDGDKVLMLVQLCKVFISFLRVIIIVLVHLLSLVHNVSFVRSHRLAILQRRLLPKRLVDVDREVAPLHRYK